MEQVSLLLIYLLRNLRQDRYVPLLFCLLYLLDFGIDHRLQSIEIELNLVFGQDSFSVFPLHIAIASAIQLFSRQHRNLNPATGLFQLLVTKALT